jgi:multimeric flavodoxin WrbA
MLIIYGSSRENGNTEYLTNIMAEGIEAEKVHLRDKHIQPITDQRHTPEGFQAVDDDYNDVVKAMLKHDTIVFATPLYWYGMSGCMKNFIDRWSQSLRDSELQFAEKMKDKKMYVVIVGGDNPKIKALPLVSQFQHIFDFVKSTFAGYIIGDANAPGDIVKDEEAVRKANYYNRLLKGQAE